MHYPKVLISTLIICITFPAYNQAVYSDSDPNVVLFLVDDYGYGDISYEGNTQINTPNIDRIAKNGARFTRFYQSGAACAPTRASLLTGRYHLETGVWGVHQGRDFLRLDEKTIGNAMKEAGYATGAFGKWHSGKVWSYCAWNRGFDEGMHTSLYSYFDTRVLLNNKVIHVDGPITDVVGDRAVNFIKSNRDRPFFAYIPFQAIHEPFNSPPEIFQKYKDQGYSDHVARLYGMIEVMDANVGKVLDALEENGLTENTVVMFLGDDGPSPGVDLSYRNRRMNAEEREERRRAWSRNLRGGKGSIWEGGMITPFYIQWPGKITPGEDFSHIAGVIDLYPTILDICKIEESSRDLPLHGQSFLPVLNGEAALEAWNDRYYFDNSNFYLIPRERINMDRPEVHYIAMHHGKHKLIRADHSIYPRKDPVYYELYDVVNDPLEEKNLIDAMPELAQILIPHLEAWYEGIIDRGRAFPQAVYEVGHWQEPVIPINLDAAKTMYGSVKATNSSRRRFEGWTKVGSGVTFEINISATGFYQVKMDYQNDRATGAEFLVFTANDTAVLQVDDRNSSVSGILQLPEGRQVLHIELTQLNGNVSAIEELRGLSVRRIPEDTDAAVLKGAGMELHSGNDRRKYRQGSATADFMYGSTVPVLEVKAGSKVIITPFAENKDHIARTHIYLDFEKVFSEDGVPDDLVIEDVSTGRHTVNLEFENSEGIITVTRGMLSVL